MTTLALRPIIIIGLALILVSPASSILGAGGNRPQGTKSSLGRAGPDHNASVVIDNFTGMEMLDAAPRPDGGIGLAYDEGLWRQEIQLITRNKSLSVKAIVTNPIGQIIVLWEENRSTTDRDLYALIFDRDANQISDEITVSTAPGNQLGATMAVDSKGNFIACWQDGRSSWSGPDIYMQGFDAAGNRTGPEVLVTPLHTADSFPSIAFNPFDEFMIVWEDERNMTATNGDVYGQMYDAKGHAISDAIIIVDEPGSQGMPHVAAGNDGRYIIAWWDKRNEQIYTRTINRDGTGRGKTVQVSASTTPARYPTMAVNRRDDALIIWNEGLKGPTDLDIHGQLIDPNGSKKGDELIITNLPNFQTAYHVLANMSSYFLVMWSNWKADSYQGDIKAQWLDSEGYRFGPLIDVCSAAGDQDQPYLSVDAQDRVTAVWSDARQGLRKAYLRQFTYSYEPSGFVITNDLSPADLWAWTGFSANRTCDESCTSVNFLYSTNRGTSWLRVPANGSLATANPGSRIRIKAELASSDGQGTPVLYGITLDYLFNRPPLLSSPDSRTVNKKTTVDIWMNVSDPDGDPITCIWQQLAGPSIPVENISAANLSFTPVISGSYSFRAVANDGFDDSNPATITVTAVDQPPRAVLNVDNTRPYVGQKVLLDASGSTDPDDNITEYNFRFGDGLSSGWGAGSSVEHKYSKNGNFEATVSARDEEGNLSTSDPIIINAVRPTVPMVLIVSPYEGQEFNASTIYVGFTLDNFVLGADGGHLSFQVDGGTARQWSGGLQFMLSGLSEGTHALTIYLEDGNNTRLANPEASATVNFSVTNLPDLPDLQLTGADVRMKPAKPADGDTLTLSVTFRNIGKSDAGAFKVRFIVDGAITSEVDVPGLARNGSTVHEFRWRAVRGPHELGVALDPTNAITEFNEGDNEVARTISVEERPKTKTPDLVLPLILILVIVGVGVTVFGLRKRIHKS